ncbi:MAG TPA: NAD-dependent epimerase/dehydratase family protein [Candidatus Paceibacterota bacterium]|nr:NAD-dependent epimerase/dehydratase family protein [Candidatus Paceibacterota bacterium]
MKHTLLITGAAGYVGTMLVQEFARRDDVERVIGLDREPVPDLIKDEPKLVYIQASTEDGSWQGQVAAYRPDLVIHTAWDIRAVYGNTEATWRSNIDGSDAVFDFAFENVFVKRLVHFSTVASYGSFPDNTIEYRFTEEDPFRKTDYLYAEEKRIAEVHLRERYEASDKKTEVAIVRPAAITGPRGRFMRMRFGLQAALSGQLRGARIYAVIKALVAFVPVTPKWARQFIHEDDVVGIVERLAFGDSAGAYEVFNICPPGPIVRGEDMARAVGKRALPVFPWMVRIAFFVFWHLSRGKVPTTRGSWKGYSYPIVVDGGKVTRQLGYTYQHEGYDAFFYTNGRYEPYVPEEARRHKV